MPNQRPEDPSVKLKHSDEIDEIFGRANPNPTREGCPGNHVLVALARRERPLNDPGYVHLTRCSPCYLEVRALQEEAAHQRRQRLAKLAAVAAMLVVVIVGVIWFFVAGPGRSAPDVRAQLDLRPYALTRSDAQDVNRQPLRLPRGRVTLTLLLPVGSEPGAYEIQLLAADLTSHASATGMADIKDFVTTLQASLDLSRTSAGRYQLAVRRAGQEWQLFPAAVE